MAQSQVAGIYFTHFSCHAIIYIFYTAVSKTKFKYTFESCGKKGDYFYILYANVSLMY